MATQLTLRPPTNAVQPSGAAISPELARHLGSLTAPDWQRPDAVTPDVRAEAAAEHRRMVEQDRPASEEHRLNWLLSLSFSVAGLGPAEGRLKAEAMARTLARFPVSAWSDAALERAIGKFKFWPSGAELTALFEAEARPRNERRTRLWKLANLCRVDRDAEPPAPLTADQIAEVGKMAAEARQRLSQRGPVMPAAVVPADPLRRDPGARAAALAEIAAHRERNAAEGAAP